MNTRLGSSVCTRMDSQNISRRQMLSRLGLTAASGTLVGALPASAAEAEKGGPSPMVLNVRDFGAVGDGSKDNTAAFVAAMRAAADTGNYCVFVPRGRYLIKGNLEVPTNVMLQGVFDAPSGRNPHDGSVLLAVEGAGDAKGKPFITLRQSCTLHGLTIFYPEQKLKNPPVAYPWTIRGHGDNISLIEVAKSNTGPVKFTACGFWGVPTTDHHAVLEGTGHTTFNGCHFNGWGQRDKSAPAILARSGGLTVTGCDFMDLGKAQITLEPEVEAALIYGNRLREKQLITNRAGSCAQIGMNAVSRK